MRRKEGNKVLRSMRDTEKLRVTSDKTDDKDKWKKGVHRYLLYGTCIIGIFSLDIAYPFNGNLHCK